MTLTLRAAPPDQHLRTRAPRPPWAERLGAAGLLAATAVLYLWGLSASGWANAYYSAAAQAGSQSWTAWFFGSSQPAHSNATRPRQPAPRSFPS